MKRRHDGRVARTARDDEIPATDLASVRHNSKTEVRLLDRLDLGLSANRRVARLSVSRDEVDGFGHRHEAVRVVTLVAIAGQPTLRIRRQESQGLPTLASPRACNLVALEYDVVYRALGEKMTRRKSGVTGADDGRSDAFDCRSRSSSSITVCVLRPTRPSGL